MLTHLPDLFIQLVAIGQEDLSRSALGHDEVCLILILLLQNADFGCRQAKDEGTSELAYFPTSVEVGPELKVWLSMKAELCRNVMINATRFTVCAHRDQMSRHNSS